MCASSIHLKGTKTNKRRFADWEKQFFLCSTRQIGSSGCTSANFSRWATQLSSDSTRGVLTRHIDPRPGRPGSSSLGERRNDEMRASSAARAGVGARLPGNPDRDGGHDAGMSEDMRANSMLSDESDGRNLRSEPSSRQKSVQLMREGGLSSVRVRVRRIHRAPRGIFPAVVHPRVTPRSRRRPLAFRVLLTARGRKCTRRVQLAPRGIEPREPDRATRREAQLMLPSCYRHLPRFPLVRGRNRAAIGAPPRAAFDTPAASAQGRTRNSHPFPSRHPRRNNNRSTTLVFSPARSPYRSSHERTHRTNASPT